MMVDKGKTMTVPFGPSELLQMSQDEEHGLFQSIMSIHETDKTIPRRREPKKKVLYIKKKIIVDQFASLDTLGS